MNISLRLLLKSGQNIEGILARSFGPSDSTIDITVQSEKRRLTFQLDEICAIRFSSPPVRLTIDEQVTFEEVQIVTGSTFRVAVFSRRRFLKGILTQLQDKNVPLRFIFFTFSGIRFRHEVRRIGKILHDKGLVTDEHIDAAIKMQEELQNRRLGEIVAETSKVPQEHIEKSINAASKLNDSADITRVGDILVEAGLVSRDQVEVAYRIQQQNKKVKMGEILIRQGYISEEQLLSALATKFRLRVVDLEALCPSQEAIAALSEGLVTRLQVFPVDFDGSRLIVATSTPTDPTVGDNLRFCTKFHIELVVAPSRQIAEAIDRFYHQTKEEKDPFLEDGEGEEQAVILEEEIEESQYIEPDSLVTAQINRILIDAFKRGVSDIHFEQTGSNLPIRIRYRIDGECIVAHKIAANFAFAAISRLKIISGLDITERRRPQSGKILLRYEQHKLEYRVEITPVVGGKESAVVRLMGISKPLPLSEMGLMPYNIDRFRDILVKPYGMVLCVGPTGSGKTTTLHSALSHINTDERKIWTVEDPVEIIQSGLCQVQVNAKIGFHFADALRSFLRADPDVIMVGEMRDVETARITIEASLTGHLVFSTLHTNSAPETVVRLIEMGLDPFSFADALLGIIAQRLAKALCPACKKPRQPTREEYDEIMEEITHIYGRVPELFPPYEKTAFMEKSGCSQCSGTGYKGRIAIHELMIGTQAIKQLIRHSQGVNEMKRTAIEEGMGTLKMDGIMTVFNEETDLEQIRKVCI